MNPIFDLNQQKHHLQGKRMLNPIELDQAYESFITNLHRFVPDGIIDVDLTLLSDLGVLEYDQFENDKDSEEFPHYFHVIETSDKVTLFNHQFAVWIVPKMINGSPTTLTLISLIADDKPNLEIVFSTTGIYNTPKYVLKVLKSYLSDVLDTEAVISSIGHN